MTERPVLLSEQFGQAFYVLLEAKHEFYYVVKKKRKIKLVFVYDGTPSVFVRAIWSSILHASRGKT